MLLCFLMAWLAYSLSFLFTMLYGQPGTSGYFYGFMLYMPLWAGALLIGGLVKQLQIPRKVTFALGALLFAVVLLPLAYKPATAAFDYLVLPFYAIDYLLCLALLKKLVARITK